MPASRSSSPASGRSSSQALAGLDADVIGLNEIENTPGVSPLGDETNGIVAGLNAMDGVGPYDFIDTGVIGTDAIRVGLIYRSDVVEPVGDFEVLTTAVDPRFIDTKSRPALAQTFEEKATGERFTVVVNHLKSKGSACDDIGDPIDPDGQGNCNGTRTLAAQALVDWIATDPTGSGDPDFLIMGDLNSYAMEDPIDAIKAGADDTAGTADDWTNLIAKYQGRFAYSYTFDGQAGYLDHSLANASLVGQVTGAADWHINSDEPDVVDYDTTFKPPEQEALYEPIANRSSDHDPVKVGLELNAPPTIAVTGGGTCSTSGGTVLVAVDDLQVDPTLTFGESSNTALVPNDGVTVLGSGATRSIVVNPVPRRSGTAVLSFTLSDGVNTRAVHADRQGRHRPRRHPDRDRGRRPAHRPPGRRHALPAWAMATCCAAATATTRSRAATASTPSTAAVATTSSAAAPVTTSSAAARATTRCPAAPEPTSSAAARASTSTST